MTQALNPQQAVDSDNDEFDETSELSSLSADGNTFNEEQSLLLEMPPQGAPPAALGQEAIDHKFGPEAGSPSWQDADYQSYADALIKKTGSPSFGCPRQTKKSRKGHLKTKAGTVQAQY